MILDEQSNDVHAVGRSMEISCLVGTAYNSGSLSETKPQSELNPPPAVEFILFSSSISRLC